MGTLKSTPPNGKIASFTEAIRAVLSAADRRDDMRGIASQALQLLDQDLVFEAAISHLTGIARRVHNQDVRADGTPGPHSDEVVSVRGSDKLLGDTSDVERDFLIANREALARGLLSRAEQFRNLGGAGYSSHPVPPADISAGDVLDAERRAARMEALANSLASLCEGLDAGKSAAQQEIDDQLGLVTRDLEVARSSTARLTAFAERMLVGKVVAVGRFAKTRRAVQRLGRLVEVAQ